MRMYTQVRGVAHANTARLCPRARTPFSPRAPACRPSQQLDRKAEAADVEVSLGALEAFYKEHDPSKLDTVDQIYEKYPAYKVRRLPPPPLLGLSPPPPAPERPPPPPPPPTTLLHSQRPRFGPACAHPRPPSAVPSQLVQILKKKYGKAPEYTKKNSRRAPPKNEGEGGGAAEKVRRPHRSFLGPLAFGTPASSTPSPHLWPASCHRKNLRCTLASSGLRHAPRVSRALTRAARRAPRAPRPGRRWTSARWTSRT